MFDSYQGVTNEIKSYIKNLGLIGNIVKTSLKSVKEEKDIYKTKEQNNED